LHKGLFYLTPNGSTRWWSLMDDNWRDVSGEEIFATNSGAWLIDRACADEGILMVPRWSVEECLHDGRLVELLFSEPVTVNPNQNNGVFCSTGPKHLIIPKYNWPSSLFATECKRWIN
jgi:DNA-binding transcriptional LysR family regulator